MRPRMPIELKRYAEHWRRAATLWVILSLGTAVLQCVVLVHPSWVAAEEDRAQFGLYDACTSLPCHEWIPWHIRPLSPSFEAASIAVGFATALSLVGVFAILVLLLIQDRHVYVVSSWLHFFAFVCQAIGVMIYPYAWRSQKMQEVCSSDSYRIGVCHLRWPFLLAVVLVVDHLSLAILGFSLSCGRPPRRPRRSMFQAYDYVHHLPPPPPPEVYFTNGGTMKL